MAVSEQTPYIEYTANGTTTSFALEFDCDNRDHLIVLVDDVEPVAGAWSLSNGAVVFNTAPENGKKITLQRNTPFSRTTDYQSYNNSFRPPAVNNDFDRAWYKIQELGVKDWLLDLKIQKFRDDVNLTALENTLEEARQIRDDTADSVIEVQSNVAQSQTLLGNTTVQANLAQGYANSANSANAAAQQAVIDVSTAEADVYSALSAQQTAVNNSLTAIAGGHKAYQTLAAAQADQSNLPANTVVEVTNDPTSANNGTYQWNGTTLTKSAYDPLTQAKSYTDLKVDDKFESSNNNDLFQFVDEDENIIARVSETGQLYLAGMSGSVQESMGGGSDASPKDVSLLRNLKVSDVFEPDALSLLSFANTQAIGSVVPAPFGIYKQRFDINSDWLNSFTMPVDPSYIPMETPYGDDRGVVHPHILEFPNGFNGWRYILGITGYTNGRTDEENPFLYGSNDLESFTLLTGLLDEPDVYTWEWGVKYNSDIVLAHDPISNELIVIWRRYEPITVAGAPSELKTKSYYYARRTRDLINFTEKELIWQNSTGNEIDALSPAFVYEASTNTWHLFACGGSSNVDGIRHFTNSELKEGWVFQNYIAMNAGSRAWHIDARWVGKKIVLLVQERRGDNSGSGLRFGVQDTENDFVNFTWADNFFNTSGVAVYKGTFAPEFNSDGQMRLNILWTYGPGSTSPYKFLKHTTAYFDAGRIS